MSRFSLVLSILSCTLIHAHVSAQIITVEPSFPMQNDTVTITYDATQGSGGLVGVDQVYAHTGVIIDEAGSGNWQYVQGNWGTDDPRVKMTKIGDNLHQIKYHIPSFYNFPTGTEVYELSFVFRNVDGSREGKTADFQDIFTPIYSSSTGFISTFIKPSQSQVIRTAGTSISIEIASNRVAQTTLFLDDSILVTTTGRALDYEALITEPGDYLLHFLSQSTSGTIVRDTISVAVISAPVIEELPAGSKDGITVLSDSSLRCVLYAPEKDYVYVIGEWNDFALSSDQYMRVTPDGLRWWIDITNLDPEDDYGMQYLVDGEIRIADPYSRLVLDPFNDRFIPDAHWPDLRDYPEGARGILSWVSTAVDTFAWQSPSPSIPAEELVIYEMLLRDFLDTENYATLLDSLTYLADLGVNAIELMPIQEYEGNDSWGYNPSFHAALDKYYGSPESFKQLVDSAHALDIAIILDVVYNHAFSQSPLCQLYWDFQNFRPTEDNPWVNVEATHPFNVGYDLNHESEATQTFVKNVVQYWIEEYRIDGFRFDLSKGFTQRVNTDVGAWSAYDASRIAILKDYADHIWNIDADNYIILEHFGDNQEEKELADYGMMLWGNANHTMNQATMGYNSGGESDFSYIYHRDDARDWEEPRVVGYIESHDEERLYYRNTRFGSTADGHNTRDEAIALERLTAAHALMLSIPGPKMIWQFGELGFPYGINRCTDGSISNDCRLSRKPTYWEALQDENRASMQRQISRLLDLRSTHSIYHHGDFEMQVFGSIKTMQLSSDTLDIVLAANMDTKTLLVSPRFSTPGMWYDLMTGDSLRVESRFDVIEMLAGEYRLLSNRRLTEGDITTSTSGRTVAGVSNLLMYPNPSSDFITISSDELLPVSSYSIYDRMGRLVRTELLDGYQLPLAIKIDDLETGLYYVRLESEESLIVQAFQVVR